MSLRWLFDSFKSNVTVQPSAINVKVNDEDFVVVPAEEFNIEQEFELIEPHPAYSQPIEKLKYEKSDPGLRNSSHKVVKGIDSTNDTENFIKFNDKEAMLYAEAFMNHLYSLSLLYGVGRCYVCYDDYGKPVALRSKAIPGFATFKEHKLTAEQLSNPAYRHRFIRILAVMFRTHEDDAHSGNITTNLQVFDADCAFWDATFKIKGGRPNVDNLGTLLSRNPETAFALHEDDITHFPNITYALPWYFPSLDAVATSYFSNNPFTPEETRLVKELEKHPETLQICLVEFLDWMLDLSQRFPYLIGLTIPKNCSYQGENLTELYCKKNRDINEEYWKILPKIPQFHDFFKKSCLTITQELMVRCEIRNRRLANDKKIHPGHDNEFEQAMLDTHLIIKQINELIGMINSQQILAFSCYASHSIFVSGRSTAIDEIDEQTAKRMRETAKRVADEMMISEASHGIDSWEIFGYKREIDASGETINKTDRFISTLS